MVLQLIVELGKPTPPSFALGCHLRHIIKITWTLNIQVILFVRCLLVKIRTFFDENPDCEF